MVIQGDLAMMEKNKGRSLSFKAPLLHRPFCKTERGPENLVFFLLLKENQHDSQNLDLIPCNSHNFFVLAFNEKYFIPSFVRIIEE